MSFCDAATKHVQFIPIEDKEMTTTAEALFEYSTKWGFPSHTVSDQGSEFVNRIWTELRARLGISLETNCSCAPRE